MGINPNQRLLTHQHNPPISNEASSSSSSPPISPNSKKKWSNFVPIFVILVVIAEIGFLGRLDMAKNAALFADKLYQFTTTPYDDDGVAGSGSIGSKSIGSGSIGSKPIGSGSIGSKSTGSGSDLGSGEGSCEEWLEREDYVKYVRDFEKDPILVHGSDEELKSCAVGCKFGYDQSKKVDAVFGMPGETGPASVIRSMESSHYYSENNIDLARRRGYKIVMTTSLSSDVPVGYFSWAEYDIMAPPQPKTEKALAAAFISNCAARNFRLQALEALEKENIKIDSYGGCHRNRNGHVDKVEALRHYKFSLAFENSNEEDYVTEKFFQSLVAGSVPIVVGAPNIQDFAPARDSILHIKELKDVVSVANTMKYLAENADAYNKSLRWKFEGPSDSFKALVDMAAVHSSCRLCIHLASTIREKEEKSFRKRPCKCTRGLETVYHVYVRERGRFEMQSIFLRSSSLALEAFESAVLSKYKSAKHVPIWKPERPESIRGGDALKVYRIYPLGKTQREALYTFRFQGDAEFRNHIENNPCAKFEVIFV